MRVLKLKGLFVDAIYSSARSRRCDVSDQNCVVTATGEQPLTMTGSNGQVLYITVKTVVALPLYRVEPVRSDERLIVCQAPEICSS